MTKLSDDAPAPNLYFDRQFNTQAVKILPGEYYATTRELMIVTVLGSCVSACIRDRARGMGGMNHFMLPASVEQSDEASVSARYGTYAMEILINQLLKMGARRQDLEAKVFGGGNVVKGFSVSNVGERNSRFVRDYLRVERIPVMAEDLLDIYPRKVYFFPATGRVLVRKLMKMHNDTIVRREQEYRSRLQAEKVGGDVDLF
jgi:chemotaxis protein CheD